MQQEALHFDRYCVANYLRGGSFAMKFRGKVCSRKNKKVEIALTLQKAVSPIFHLNALCFEAILHINTILKIKLDIYSQNFSFLTQNKNLFTMTRLKTHQGLNEKSGKYDRCEFKLMAESVRCCRKFRELAKSCLATVQLNALFCQNCFAFSRKISHLSFQKTSKF